MQYYLRTRKFEFINASTYTYGREGRILFLLLRVGLLLRVSTGEGKFDICIAILTYGREGRILFLLRQYVTGREGGKNLTVVRR